MRKKYKILSYLLILTFLMAIIPSNTAKAATSNTFVTVGPFDDTGPHDYTVTLPYLDKITSITVDNGTVAVKSINGNNVTFTVKDGKQEPAQTLTKTIQLDIPLTDPTGTDAFDINDMNTKTEETKQYDSDGNTHLLPYPRYENWFHWTPDPENPGKYMWGTLPRDGYQPIGLDECGKNITLALQNKSGNYTDSEGYSAPWNTFQQLLTPGWYPRNRDDNGNLIPGYITSDKRYGLPQYDSSGGKYQYTNPRGEPTGPSDSAYYNNNKDYEIVRYGAYNYTAHFVAQGTKTVYNKVSYRVEIDYTTTPMGNITCSINAPKTVAVGDDCTLFGSADSQNGDIIDWYWWSVPSNGANDFNLMQGQRYGTVWFGQEGVYHPNLQVTDEAGASAQAEATITVVPPIPSVNIITGGTLKENRKVILDASSSYSGSRRYSIDWTKAVWTITPVSSGLTSSDIKTADSLTGSQKLNVLFKKVGDYKVSCSLTNTYGKSATTEITITIQPDLPPVADFTVPNRVLRDPQDKSPDGLSQNTITFIDNSSSPDGDIIAKRAWFFTFNANNNKVIRDSSGNIIKKLEIKEINSKACIVITDINGNTLQTINPGDPQYDTYMAGWADMEDNFDDDQTYIYDLDYNNTENSNQMPWNHSINPHWRPICLFKDIKNVDISNINTGNLTQVILKSTHVGKYRSDEIAVEEFGQETIPQFVTPQDRKHSSTFE